VYREQATFYTDQYATNHIERFNNTLRQRGSRLVRGTLAFSKKVEHHIGAIRYFISSYNLARAALLV
jgi:insertion element IS1 protein InsB